MKIAKTEAERCVESFDEHRCSLKQGHRTKHHCFDLCSVAWTDGGKERVLRERAEAASKASKDSKAAPIKPSITANQG